MDKPHSMCDIHAQIPKHCTFPSINPFYTQKKKSMIFFQVWFKIWNTEDLSMSKSTDWPHACLKPSETFCISAITWIQPWKERLLTDKMTKINFSPPHLCVSKQLLQADATAFLTVTQMQGCTLSSNQVTYKLQLFFFFLLEPI